MEMEKIPKFKALPLDRKIFESGGVIGIKRVPKLAPTVPTVRANERISTT
jgi:hypothetical protein